MKAKAADLAAGLQKLWRCPWCIWPIEAATRDERWDHCLDLHLEGLKQATSEILAHIVKP